MTMQVGMMASNGVVLASDTKCSRDALNSDGLVADDSYGCSKIRIDDSGQIAVTCARDMIAATKVADALMSELKPELWENPEQSIREIGRNVMATVGKNLEIECLIGLAKPVPTLYKFQYVQDGAQIVCDRIPTFAHTGHALNAAIFWSLCHYRKEPIKNLMALASILVVDAAQLNSARIGGLELVYADESGFHRVPLTENERMEREAKRRSERIARQVMKPL
jgi:hypothetical protein